MTSFQKWIIGLLVVAMLLVLSAYGKREREMQAMIDGACTWAHEVAERARCEIEVRRYLNTSDREK